MPAKRRGAVVPAASELHVLLESSRISRRNIRYPRGATLFAQGAPANTVFYLKDGAVKLSVLSSTGKEAVIGMLGPGEFFGEGCLAGQSLRMGTATAIVPTTVQRFPKAEMSRALHERSGFTDQFLTHMLRRNIRIEADLVDQLFNSSEKRLARTLLLLARYGTDQSTSRSLPKISQETLAEIVGTTRSRVNYFMNKFRRLGLIKYNGGLTVNNSLLSIILHD
jgi:CRP/FNR family cyclic AMP-dependent transcriptional regulator